MRNTRPAPRTFAQFPEHAKCPICRTNDEGEAVIVPINGTRDGKLCKAAPMHLYCCIPKEWDEDMQMAMTWPAAAITKEGKT